ncbi:MAG: hypothetical protein LBP62_03300 [Clostridiales bacterium]|jgi:hypothetical protein|nr:hypothetical protein [Clostridiales bacterium]
MLQNIKKIKFICDRCGAVAERDGPLVKAVAAIRRDGWKVAEGREKCWCAACVPAHNREIELNYEDSIYNIIDGQNSS